MAAAALTCSPAARAEASALARHGLWAVPLAFAALPLYVHLPAHMAAQPGWSLSAVGGLLVATRSVDAWLDPWLGRRIDRVGQGRGARVLALGLAGGALLGAGWSALFMVAWPSGMAGAVLLGLVVLLTSIGHSVAQIAHQAWGVALAGGRSACDERQARWVGAREAGTLLGVIVASVLPAIAGWPLTVVLWWMLALLGAMALGSLVSRVRPDIVQGAVPGAAAASATAWPCGWTRPLLVQLSNGIAAAIPATLVLLVVRDVLGGGAAWQAGALLVYFGAAALAVPLAVRLVTLMGARRAWARGMAGSSLAFLPFAVAPTGTVFLLVCAATGAALALETLAGQALWIARLNEAQGEQRARGFGWWALVNKAALALAAGLSLPLVQALGYRAGSGEAPAQGLAGLLLVYVAVPVAFKLLAVALLLMPRTGCKALPFAARKAASPPVPEVDP